MSGGSPDRCVSPGGRVDDWRLDDEVGRALVSQQWAAHEAAVHAACRGRPASPPAWQTELQRYPDMGPADSLYALKNKNRPQSAMDWDPEAELVEKVNPALQIPSTFRVAPSEGDGAGIAGDGEDDVPSGIADLYRRSETRTPLMVPWSTPDIASESAAVRGITTAAAKRGSSVVLHPLDSGSEQQREAAIERVGQALCNGDWPILIQRVAPDEALYRRLAILLMTLEPEPQKYPRRELFRLWVVYEERVDLSQNIAPVYPAVFTHQALQLSGGDRTRHKVVRKLCADPVMRSQQLQWQAARQDRGRGDADAESLPEDDDEAAAAVCSPRKLTGAWFVRSREMAEATDQERARARLDAPSKIVFRRRHLNAFTRVHA